ncbi:hypothetical protein BJX68DRAFT_260275 [Aspergillus pseudodeflectus]|uniref:Uncharacterized protein n=1 Tax=Aspergillus pseudodeflectus TaxID=176178 RepID=A0ABR4LAR9_9EURO
MMLQYATVFIGLCGAALTAPTRNPRGIFPFPILPFPGESAGPGLEPVLPFPSEFPSELSDSTSGISRFPFLDRCGELPGGFLSALENIPWEQLSTEESGQSPGLLMEEEEIGQEEETELMS